MKKTLGLHFGHDAAACLLREDGELIYFSKERNTGIKHAWGLSHSDFSELLEATSVAATTTQYAPGYFIDDVGSTKISSPYLGIFSKSTSEEALIEERREYGWVPRNHTYFGFTFPDSLVPTVATQHLTGQIWGPKDIDRPVYIDGNRISSKKFVLSASFENRNTTKEFLFRPHHFSHAAYAHYSSPFKEALIISLDGGCGLGWDAGGYFWGNQDGIKPITPGGFWFGRFYDTVAAALGLDAGKLMGLAPYGKPVFDNLQLTGSLAALLLADQGNSIIRGKRFAFALKWLAEISEKTRVKDFTAWNKNAVFPPVLQCDIASSAQLIIERNMRLVVQRGISIANQHSLSPDGVVLVGGVALNCPANSQISRELNIPIWIPPACNDEGLAIGSAALAMQEATGLWVKAMHSPSQALIGNSFTTEHQDRVFSQHFQRITTSDKFATAAKLLDAGRIGCTFFGRSEVGPRALGNRSIIADARSDSTWMEVNRRKGREVWRPLAPIVLSDEFGRFFDGGPSNSWFMLFTHRVVSNDLPAITHRDFSARAQACNSENGDIFKLLNIFYSVTGCPVLLNTSFNGPGVPIVESPEMAAKEMMKLGLDFIICDAGIYIPRCPKS